MVVELRSRKSLLRPPQPRGTRLDGIEQRPVALLQLIPLWKWSPQLQPERTQHAVVAIVALQHDANEYCSGRPATGAEFLCDRVAPQRIESRDRLSSQPREMIEPLAYHIGI